MEQLETISSGVCLPSLCKIMSNTTKSSTQTQAVVRIPSLPQGHTRDGSKPHSMPFSRAASCNSIKEHAHLIFSPAKEQSTIKSTHSQEAAQPATSVYQANRDHLIHVCERGKISASPWSRLRLRHYDPRHHFADPENDMKGWIKPQCIG